MFNWQKSKAERRPGKAAAVALFLGEFFVQQTAKTNPPARQTGSFDVFGRYSPMQINSAPSRKTNLLGATA